MGYITRCMSEMAKPLSQSSLVESKQAPIQEPSELIEREHPLIEAMGVSLDALPEADPSAAREIGDALVKPFLDQDNQ